MALVGWNAIFRVTDDLSICGVNDPDNDTKVEGWLLVTDIVARF